jgi:MAF protein
VVIGADTVVVAPTRKSGTSGLVPEILGKPGSPAQAETMLRELRGCSHQVFTGLAVRSAGGKQLHSNRSVRILTDWCVTQVTMRAYSETEVRDYVQSGDPLDKAGAYAIQHTGFDPVQSIVGCYANVVGLPLCHLTRLLRVLKLEPAKDLTDGCLTPDGYDCQLVATIQQQPGG